MRWVWIVTLLSTHVAVAVTLNAKTSSLKSLTEALHQTVSIQITPYVNDFQTFNNPGSWQPVKTLKMSLGLYLPFLTRVFHSWRPETCGVIQQQFRIKECDIYGGQNMLFFEVPETVWWLIDLTDRELIFTTEWSTPRNITTRRTRRVYTSVKAADRGRILTIRPISIVKTP